LLAIAGIVIGMSSRAMATQDPAKLAPQFYKVVLDDDHVRVIDYLLKPEEKRTHAFASLRRDPPT
jgi:hypothetical protein